jgi:hypothetical protein
MRIPFTFFIGATSAAVLLALSELAAAQTKPSASPAPPVQGALPAPVVAADADRILRQMSAYISSAEQFTFHAEVTFDHVLPTGQKLQFAATEDVALQRPNGLYIQWSGDLGGRQFWYDGKTVTLYDPRSDFYAVDKVSSGIDGMLDKVTAQLNFTPPLADFLYSDPYKSVHGSIQYGFTTGVMEINGRACNGLAFVEKHIDWQIWIDSGPQLVPCKLIITYKNNPSLPQFSAVFSDWDFAPRIAAPTFTPDLPAGTQEVPFITVTASASPK